MMNTGGAESVAAPLSDESSLPPRLGLHYQRTIKRSSARYALHTGDRLPWRRIARHVSFVIEPNNLRKPVAWPRRRGIGKALVRRRDDERDCSRH